MGNFFTNRLSTVEIFSLNRLYILNIPVRQQPSLRDTGPEIKTFLTIKPLSFKFLSVKSLLPS